MGENVESTGLLESNYHIHTRYSPRVDLGMTFESVLDAAAEIGLRRVGFSDHCFSYELNSARVKRLRAELEAAAEGRSVEACLGVEAYVLGSRYASVRAGAAGLFDYVLMVPNHYHLRGVAHPASLEPRLLADHELYMFELAAGNAAADVVAHPFALSPRVFAFEEERLASLSQKMFEALDWKRLAQTLDRMRDRGIAVELNGRAASYGQDGLLDFYRFCVERGVLIAFGADARALPEVAPGEAARAYAESLQVPEELVWRPFCYQ